MFGSLVFAITFVSFLPVLRNDFLELWDDGPNFLSNPQYRGLGWTQLRWMFTTMHMGHYHPLTWMTLGLDYLLWGMNPAGYHLTSLLLHAANTAVFYLITRRLLAAVIPSRTGESDHGLDLGAAFAALFFAVHPLRVESVAWVSERRDVLSGLFYLLAILAYLRYAQDAPEGAFRARRWYWVSLAMLGLALLSKSMAVSLPAILLVLDVYPLRRLGGPGRWWGPAACAVWVEKLPFIVLGAVASAVQFVATMRVGELPSTGALGLAERVSLSLYGPVFYLWKTVLPIHLSPLYPRKTPIDPLAWTFVLSGALVLAVSALAITLRRRWPALAAEWIVYLAVLLPVLGIFQSAKHLAADRYTYLATMGWAVLGGGTLAFWRLRATRRQAAIGAGLAAAAVAVLATLTWQQLSVWRDSVTLWSHARALDPSSPSAAQNLGLASLKKSDFEGAIRYYREAVALDPDFAEAWNNLGLAHAKRAEFDEALAAFRRALEIDPKFSGRWNNLGVFYAQRGRFQEAAAAFVRALEVDPANRIACTNGRQAARRAGTSHPALERCEGG